MAEIDRPKPASSAPERRRWSWQAKVAVTAFFFVAFAAPSSVFYDVGVIVWTILILAIIVFAGGLAFVALWKRT